MPIYAFDCLMGQTLIYARNEKEASDKAARLLERAVSAGRSLETIDTPMRQSRKFGVPYPTKLRLATGADIVYAASQGRYIPKEEDSEDRPESSTNLSRGIRQSR